MKKSSGKEIVERIKKKRLGTSKSNYTYRLDDDLIKKFVNKCETLGIKPTHVIEELIEEFLGSV